MAPLRGTLTSILSQYPIIGPLLLTGMCPCTVCVVARILEGTCAAAASQALGQLITRRARAARRSRDIAAA